MSSAMIAAELVAKAPSGEAAKSGPWGLAIILILCAACYFLFKSMSKHLRKVREGFPAQGKKLEPPAQQADSAPDAADQVRPDRGADAGTDSGDGPAQP
jgi:hypothetical protein